MVLLAPFVLVSLLVLVGITAAAVWLGISMRNKAARAAAAGPVCGACAYSVIGLTTMTCPECGADLRAAGILAPRTPRPTAPVTNAIIGFTVLLGIIALIVTPALLSILPARRSYGQEVRLLSPTSGAYNQVVLRSRGRSWGAGHTLLPVELELQLNPPTSSAAKPPQPARMTVRPDGAHKYTAAPGAPPISRSSGFGPAAVLDWMKAAGLDTAQPALRQEAARLAGEVRIISRGGRRALADAPIGGFSSRSSGADSGGQFASRSTAERADTNPPLWVTLPLAAIWLILWLLGLRHLTRRTNPLTTNP
jgi:hypothetical protein